MTTRRKYKAKTNQVFCAEVLRQYSTKGVAKVDLRLDRTEDCQPVTPAQKIFGIPLADTLPCDCP